MVYVGAFRRAGDNLLTLINDILDLSKIEAGRIDLQSVDFDLDELVAAALDLMRVRADDKGLDIVCELSPRDSPRAQGRSGSSAPGLDQPSGQCSQVHRERAMSVFASTATPGAGRWASDAAIFGFGHRPRHSARQAVADLRNVYAGRRLHQSPVRGNGVGSTISRQIVERMGGRLEVSSVPGKGSTLVSPSPSRWRPSKASRPDATSPPAEQPVAGLRILLAEDSERQSATDFRLSEANGPDARDRRRWTGRGR